jgi:hypothetical protein
VLACRSEPANPLDLAVGSEPRDRTEFSPRSAFAEYVELPGVRNELRITLASYDASCERFIPPGPGQALITIVVVTPDRVVPTPGTYAWNGEAAPAAAVRPQAAPNVRLGPASYVLPPGGALELTHVELDLQKQVAGRLAFEFSGDATRAATHARGAFRARICRSRRAEP